MLTRKRSDRHGYTWNLYALVGILRPCKIIHADMYPNSAETRIYVIAVDSDDM
jgi:hypothetical protein